MLANLKKKKNWIIEVLQTSKNLFWSFELQINQVLLYR
jgi:hypothetical protein